MNIRLNCEEIITQHPVWRFWDPRWGGSSIVDHFYDLILSNQWISTKRTDDTLEISKECVGFTIHEQLGGQKEEDEEDLNEKWHGMLQRGVQYLQNNAPAHKTCKMMDILKNLVFECTDHLLTRSCFIWLSPVITTLKEKNFWNVSEVLAGSKVVWLNIRILWKQIKINLRYHAKSVDLWHKDMEYIYFSFFF